MHVNCTTSAPVIRDFLVAFDRDFAETPVNLLTTDYQFEYDLGTLLVEWARYVSLKGLNFHRCLSIEAVTIDGLPVYVVTPEA